jgi:hypothetical protein
VYFYPVVELVHATTSVTNLTCVTTSATNQMCIIISAIEHMQIVTIIALLIHAATNISSLDDCELMASILDGPS